MRAIVKTKSFPHSFDFIRVIFTTVFNLIKVCRRGFQSGIRKEKKIRENSVKKFI